MLVLWYLEQGKTRRMLLPVDNSRTPFGQTDPTSASMNKEKRVALKGFQENENPVQEIVSVLNFPLASHMSDNSW